MRFGIRDLIWLTVVVALVAALISKHQSYNRLLIAATNLQVAYENICEFAVLNERWEITTKKGFMEIRRPSDDVPPNNGIPSKRFNWRYPSKDGLAPFARKWNWATVTGKEP